MNANISSDIQDILDQLTELKVNHGSLRQGIEKQNTPKRKTTAGVNTELLTSDQSKQKNVKSTRYKILIAEPSDLFSRVIEEIFAETVFKYLLVNDGQLALSQINKFKPDVVLLAYDLPSRNGIEITKSLRDNGNMVPVIAYTHSRDKGVLKRWVTWGLSGYLIKPSKKSIILKSVSKAIKNPVEIILHNSTSNKAEIQWNTKYSVGNHEMDEQHKELFNMTNEFFKQESKQSAIILFESLSSYIDLHFESEENLMKQMNFPKTDEHIKSHDEIRNKLIALRKKLDSYNIDIQHKIALFLYNSLANHILRADMEYKSYAQSLEVSSFEHYVI